MSELQHHGVKGQKWGVIRKKYVKKSTDRLKKKAYEYDIKRANYSKKSEKIHATEDLEGANRVAKKASNYQKKAAKLHKKALGETDETKRLSLEKKAGKAEYKGAVKRMKANRISKTVGYSAKAMKYSVKSDKMAAKAAKARMKIASNEAYVAALDRKLSSYDPNKISRGRELVNQIMSKIQTNK